MKLRIALLAGCVLMVPAAAYAEAAETADSEEIIVTAQKRDQRLTDVPISITALQGSALDEHGTSRMMDLAQVVPGLRVDQNGAYSAPTVRGVGSSIAGTGFSNNVAVYVDGFYNPSQSTTDSLLVNLESVEVLKGPQGTLFGRNATGGAILMRLREPSFNSSIEGRVSYGRFNSLEGGVYATTALNDKIAVDVSFAYSGSDGFLTDVVTGNDKAGKHSNYAVRSAILLQPSDAVSFKLAFQLSEDRDHRPYATAALADANGNPMSFGPAVGGIAVTERGQVANSGKTEFDSNVKGIYLTSKFDLGGAQLTSLSMWRKERTQNFLDLDASAVRAFEGVFYLHNRTLSQEFNLSGTSGKLDWLVGAFYLNHKDNQGPFPVTFGAALTGLPTDTLVDLYSAGVEVNAYAVYADLTYEVMPQLFLTGGARYSHEKSQAFWNIPPLANAFGIGAGTGAGPGRVDFQDSWNSFTPRAVLRYNLTPSSNVYVSWSRGFKSGLLTPNAFDATPLRPEKIDAFEAGYKFGGSRIRGSFAAFYYDYKDMQVAYFVSGTGVYRNAATSEIYGFEAALNARVTDELTFNGGVAYTHGRYKKFPVSASYLPTGLGTFAASLVDASGLRMQRSPDWTGNVSVDWSKPIGDYKLGLNGGVYFTSAFPFDTSETYVQKGYALVNLGASFGAENDSWKIGLYGRNIFDKVYRTQILPGDFAIQQVYGEPATYGVTVSFKY